MTQDVAINSDGRGPDGRWLPGFGGRPKGSRNKISRNTLTAVQSLSSEAVMQLKTKMQSGDMQAIRLILEYTLPRGGRSIELDSSEPNALIDAAAMGDISPDEAARLAQAYKTAGDASELKEIKRQIEELEMLITALKR